MSYCLLWELFSCIFQGSGPCLGQMLCYQCLCHDRPRTTLARRGWCSANREHSIWCLCQGDGGMGGPGSKRGSGCGASDRSVQECGLQLLLRAHRVVWSVGFNTFPFLNICTVLVCGLNYSHGLFWARFWCPQLYPRIKLVFFIFKLQEGKA